MSFRLFFPKSYCPRACVFRFACGAKPAEKSLAPTGKPSLGGWRTGSFFLRLPGEGLGTFSMASKVLPRLSRCVTQASQPSRRRQCRFLSTTPRVASEALQVVSAISSVARCVALLVYADRVSSTVTVRRTTLPYPSSSMLSARS